MQLWLLVTCFLGATNISAVSAHNMVFINVAKDTATPMSISRLPLLVTLLWFCVAMVEIAAARLCKRESDVNIIVVFFILYCYIV